MYFVYNIFTLIFLGWIMNTIQLKAKAKINLSLDVLGKRQDGYHELKTIMQTVELHDIVTLETAESGIQIGCNKQYVPADENNIAWKAANLLIKKYNIKKGIRIYIQKNIPVAAGLAGGSADAASVLRGINLLYNLGMSNNELMAAGLEIGADVPFCIRGGTMLAEGIGEKLTPLKCLDGVDILIIKPKVSVSTAWVYKNLDLSAINFRPDTDKLISAIEQKKLDFLAENMKNVLETVTLPKHKVLDEIKSRLIECGALGSMMSGSGPSVFGIFKNRASAEKAYNILKSNEWDCYITKTSCSSDNGIFI